MRKLLLFCLLASCYSECLAQTKAGLRIAPSLTFNRVVSESDTLVFSPNGVGGRFMFGPIFDFPLGSSNGFFTTGLLYAPQRVGLSVKGKERVPKYNEVYKLQYLQIPGTFSFYTNEISLDTRLYFEVGVEMGIKIHERTRIPIKYL